jgi:hypothetical protein
MLGPQLLSKKFLNMSWQNPRRQSPSTTTAFLLDEKSLRDHVCEPPLRAKTYVLPHFCAFYVCNRHITDTISKIKKGDMHASEYTGAQRSCQ